jgi:predicted MFS family arabinose efflux permease
MERRPEPGTLALVLLCSASFVVVLDVGVVTVALPSISRDLGMGPAALQWVLAGYSLVFGGLLLLGGRAGDLFGRRRLFRAGFALLAGFVAVERRAPATLVPLDVLRRPSVAAPNAAIVLTAATGASTYLLTLYLQRALGRSPLEAGLSLLPLSVAAAAAGPAAGRLVRRLAGPGPTMVAGLALGLRAGVVILAAALVVALAGLGRRGPGRPGGAGASAGQPAEVGGPP